MSRKILLTVILSFIAPGSAGQVVAGLILSFFVLLINIYAKPFVTPSLNYVNQASHLCTFLFFLTGLLLKVNVDGQGDSGAFSAVVSVLCVAPIVLPAVLPFALRFYTAMMTKGEPLFPSSNYLPPDMLFSDNFNLCNVCESMFT